MKMKNRGNRKAASIVLLACIAMLALMLTSSAHAATYAWKIPDNVRIVQKAPVDGVRTFATIAEALASITDASAANRYLVKVMPGVYNEPVVMKSYVDVAGSGQDITVITFDNNYQTVLFQGVNESTLENLTVTGSVTSAIYLLDNSSAVIKNVKVVIVSNVTTGIYASTANSLQMFDSKIVQTAGAVGSVGVNFHGRYFLVSGCMVEMSAVIAGGGPNGIFAQDPETDTTIINTIVKLKNTNTGGSYGISLDNGKIINSDISVEAASDSENVGIFARNTTIQNTKVKVSSVNSVATYGLWGSNIIVDNSTISSSFCGIEVEPSIVTAGVKVNNSSISGTSIAIHKNPEYAATVYFKAGNTQLVGSYSGIAGVDRVVNCYDGNYDPLPNL